ncbi:MAG: serine hydrolase domain-containing protein [Ferruginibacter sp.]|nr:serine hydrolase domain-containing protein [Ferruginibacter sp.]
MKHILTLVIIITSFTVTAQTWQDTTLMIDKILSRYSATAPGAQLAISRGGQVIYSFANGLAEMENKVPLTKESLIEAGSVSKQFTAACILLLEQQGKLSLEDDVRKYVPEVPVYERAITLHHLLHHTSGLKDWGAIAELSGWPRSTKAYTNDDVLHFISLQKTLNNIPGDEYIYSNSNYNLLAIIVQRVNGASLAIFSAENIFKPAGMQHTSWRDNYRRIVPNRAIAYSKFGNVYQTTMPNENAYGNGGLLTTAEDLLKWNNYYLNGKFGTPSLLSRQKATEPLNNGRKNSYAAGLVVDSTNGWASVTHSGATAGYRANIEFYPALDMSIAWLSNTSQPDLSDVFAAVRNLLVKKSVSFPASDLKADSSITITNFKPYLGSYQHKKTGAGLTLYESNGQLLRRDNSAALQAISATEVIAGRSKIRFTSVNPHRLEFSDGSGLVELFEGVDSARADTTSLREYIGAYYSDETESRIEIKIQNGVLQAFQKTGATMTLTPQYRDGFSFPGGQLFFTRDKNTKPAKFFVSISRARNVEFSRKP